jgi:hypothetical protein
LSCSTRCLSLTALMSPLSRLSCLSASDTITCSQCRVHTECGQSA